MGIRALFAAILLGLAWLSLAPVDVRAQTRAVPYWASTQYTGVRMRVGPSEQYPIKWEYRDEGLPLKVVRRSGGWRLVEDPDGEVGWVSSSQLRLRRTAMVMGEGLVDLLEEPRTGSKLRWRAEPGVIGRLKECSEGWCEFDVSGRTGWVTASRLWGAEELAGQ